MRARLARILALGIVLAAGCVTEEKTSSTTSWLPRFRPFQGPVGPDVVQMEVAVIERPVGDAYIDDELWQVADERVISPERKALMEEGGLRVGQVSGLMTPPGLLSLLTSKKACADPRLRRVRTGQVVPLAIGPEMPTCRFGLRRAGDWQTFDLHKAQCRITIAPSLGHDGQTTLAFTPQIIHGDSVQTFKVADDRSGLLMVSQRPTETFTELAWEARLGPNEYLIIGGRYDRPGTFGHECFVRVDDAAPVQRLLVVRTGPLERPGPGLSTGPLDDAVSASGRAPGPAPLALQASDSSVRGASP